MLSERESIILLVGGLVVGLLFTIVVGLMCGAQEVKEREDKLEQELENAEKVIQELREGDGLRKASIAVSLPTVPAKMLIEKIAEELGTIRAVVRDVPKCGLALAKINMLLDAAWMQPFLSDEQKRRYTYSPSTESDADSYIEYPAITVKRVSIAPSSDLQKTIAENPLDYASYSGYNKSK